MEISLSLSTHHSCSSQVLIAENLGKGVINKQAVFSFPETTQKGLQEEAGVADLCLLEYVGARVEGEMRPGLHLSG